MNDDKEQMQVEFHNEANAKFIAVNHAFEAAASQISRRSEEYKFQQLKKQYAGVMEREMQAVAKNVLSKFRNEKQVNDMDQLLNRFIKDYLHRFIQKVNDL